ncbi:hypothetical protein Vadar_028213 [Vaccinium darrowii]|uniref:Uncharacterized protein n=1 Tax=Vaccinium darrowii TaxID=229202 RepID=A0ACB7Z863_9ERIC|nr:hypothetical protein Vadar_028213 [Vaccinium darrowii]
MEEGSNEKSGKRKFQGSNAPGNGKWQDPTVSGCWHCGKTGHFKRDCLSLKRRKTGEKSKASEAKKSKFVAVILEVNTLVEAGDWWIDSGATKHVCNDKSITIFIFSAHLQIAQPLMYHPVANLSTTWINNIPSTININSSDGFDLRMTPVLFPSNTSQFISGFYCFTNKTSCFFGTVITATRSDSKHFSLINAPKLVWSANRDRPVDVNATLKFKGNGDLILEDADGNMVWSTDTGGKSVTGLRFTEFGNLVLFDRNNGTVWESFDHPTDSLVIGQKLMSGRKLIASTSSSDLSRGLFSLSVRYGSLFGYFETNPPLVYYKSILEEVTSSTNLKEEYVAFKSGSFNGQAVPLGSTAQFMRLEPDGHLKVYEWGGDEWKAVADLLTLSIQECGYPMACGNYGICSNGQCGCLEGSNNEIGNFKQISYKQPNLGCSLVTPITCNFSRYHNLLELKDTSYFTLNSGNYDELNDKTGVQDCKNACLRNCSCKAALFRYDDSYDYVGRRRCMLLSDVFSLINNEGGYDNISVFLKVQNFPKKQSSFPMDFPQKKSRRGTIVLGSSLGAFFGVCLLVGSCVLIFKRKREPEELDDEFSVHNVPEMPIRFSYNDLKTATNDFNNKLGEGGFGSQPEEDKHLLSLFKRKAEEGLLLDLVDKHNNEMQLHGAEVVEMMRVALWCLQGDFTRRPSMSVVVKVLEGSMDVENNLDYSFTSPAVPRTIAAASHRKGGVASSTPPLPSTLSGPR